MCGWSYTSLVSQIIATYQHLQDVYLVHKCRIVFYFLLLDSLYCKELFGYTMLRQIYDSESTIS